MRAHFLGDTGTSYPLSWKIFTPHLNGDLESKISSGEGVRGPRETQKVRPQLYTTPDFCFDSCPNLS